MSELEQGNESGAISESTASSESASPAQTQEAAPQQEAVAKPQEPPFHEHPRFKEVIEQKNAAMRQVQDLQAKFAQFEQQYKQQSQPKAPDYDNLFKEMEQVNPAFAQLVKDLQTKASKADELEQQFSTLNEWKQSYESQQAVSTFDKLCTDNKIGDRDKDFYKQVVANIANAKGSRISDLPAVFKEAHQMLSTYFQDRDRETRESYVKQKKSDATPTSQTGGMPTGTPGNKGASSKDEVKAAIAAALRNGARI